MQEVTHLTLKHQPAPIVQYDSFEATMETKQAPNTQMAYNRKLKTKGSSEMVIRSILFTNEAHDLFLERECFLETSSCISPSSLFSSTFGYSPFSTH